MAPPEVSCVVWHVANQVFLAQYGPESCGEAAHTFGCVYAGVPEAAAASGGVSRGGIA
ncbi:MAG: hypothetical protein ACYDER_05715 [Ktedonobacteraceae bacterium]